MKRSMDYIITASILALVSVLLGCGQQPAVDPLADAPKQPVLFEPTIAVQLRLLPDSEGQENLEEIRAVIEEEIKKKKRVRLVEDPAAARLLIDIPFYLDKDSLNAGWYFRLQIIDTEHGVAIFEDGYCQSGDTDDPKELRDAVQSAFKQTAQWLEKDGEFSISRQIELGKGGVAYMETDAWKNERITFGRYDWGTPSHKVYVDYSVRNLRYNSTLITAVNQVYGLMKLHKVELVNSPEKADVVFRISVGSSNETTYEPVVGGFSPPAGSYGANASGAALSATIDVFRIGENQPAYTPSTQPIYTLTAEGKAPQGKTLSESPESLSLKSFESALGTKLQELKPFLKP